jgi:hypothetical protein
MNIACISAKKLVDHDIITKKDFPDLMSTLTDTDQHIITVDLSFLRHEREHFPLYVPMRYCLRGRTLLCVQR